MQGVKLSVFTTATVTAPIPTNAPPASPPPPTTTTVATTTTNLTTTPPRYTPPSLLLFLVLPLWLLLLPVLILQQLLLQPLPATATGATVSVTTITKKHQRSQYHQQCSAAKTAVTKEYCLHQWLLAPLNPSRHECTSMKTSKQDRAFRNRIW